MLLIIYLQHVYKGFYAGLTPALVGITPYMGLNFAMYEMMKSLIAISSTSTSIQRTSSSHSPSLNSEESQPYASVSTLKLSEFQTYVKQWGQKLLCGGLAGGLSKFAVYPLDTVKKRLQVYFDIFNVTY